MWITFRPARPTHSLSSATRAVTARLSGVAASRTGAAVLFAAALTVFGLQSIAWPLVGGRDAGHYLVYYVGIWNGGSVLPELMLLRTPVAPLLLGPLFHVGGSVLAEVGLAVYFAGSVVAVAA